jgi:hypothetical protein
MAKPLIYWLDEQNNLTAHIINIKSDITHSILMSFFKSIYDTINNGYCDLYSEQTYEYAFTLKKLDPKNRTGSNLSNNTHEIFIQDGVLKSGFLKFGNVKIKIPTLEFEGQVKNYLLFNGKINVIFNEDYSMCGDIKNGKFLNGFIKFKDGESFYKGTIKDGLVDSGIGKYYCNCVNYFEGEFKNGIMYSGYIRQDNMDLSYLNIDEYKHGHFSFQGIIKEGKIFKGFCSTSNKFKLRLIIDGKLINGYFEINTSFYKYKGIFKDGLPIDGYAEEITLEDFLIQGSIKNGELNNGYCNITVNEKTTNGTIIGSELVDGYQNYRSPNLKFDGEIKNKTFCNGFLRINASSHKMFKFNKQISIIDYIGKIEKCKIIDGYGHIIGNNNEFNGLIRKGRFIDGHIKKMSIDGHIKKSKLNNGYIKKYNNNNLIFEGIYENPLNGWGIAYSYNQGHCCQTEIEIIDGNVYTHKLSD